MDTQDLGQALDFDGEIEVGDDFEPVEPGEYTVEVASVERGQFNGSAKMGPCPVAKVSARIVGGPHDGRQLFDDLKLNSKMSFLIKRFFVAVGMRDPEAPKEERLHMDWTGAIGRRAAVKVKNREYNGRTYSDVEWLKPGDAAPQAAYAPPASVPAPPQMQAAVNATFQQPGGAF